MSTEREAEQEGDEDSPKATHKRSFQPYFLLKVKSSEPIGQIGGLTGQER